MPSFLATPSTQEAEKASLISSSGSCILSPIMILCFCCKNTENKWNSKGKYKKSGGLMHHHFLGFHLFSIGYAEDIDA